VRKPVQLAFLVLLLFTALPAPTLGSCYIITTPGDTSIPLDSTLMLTVLSESGKTAVTIPHIPVVDLPEPEQVLAPATPPDTSATYLQPVEFSLKLPPTWTLTDVIREAVEQTLKAVVETIGNAIVSFVNWLGNALMAFGTALYNGVVGIVNVVYSGAVRTIETIVNTPGMILNMMWQTTAGSIVDFMDALGIYGWAVSGLCYTVIVFETGLVSWAIIKVGAFLIKTLITVLIP